MAVEIIHDPRRAVAAMWCNTTGQAFGPVFTGPGCEQDADDFIVWVASSPDRTLVRTDEIWVDGTDPRDYTPAGLERMYQRWQQAADKHGQEVEA